MFEIIFTEVRGEHVLTANYTGEFERKLVFIFFDSMAEYEEKYPNYKLLVDFTAVRKGSVSFEDIKIIVQYFRDNCKGQRKTAIVTAAGGVRILIAKLFVDLMKAYKPSLLSAFQSPDEAINWLCPNNK